MDAQGSRGPQVGDLTRSLDVVKIVSIDEKVFFLSKDIACQSKKIAELLKLAPTMDNTHTRVVTLDLPSTTLETVVKYLHYRIINGALEKADRTQFGLKPEDALDVLNAAIYLQC